MNSIAKHTPGPWHINTLEVVPFSIHAHRGCVAEVSRGTMNEISADEIEANAHLIAAAPDMLEALEYAFERLNDAVDGGVLDKSPFYPSWQKVCAALTKSLGGNAQ